MATRGIPNYRGIFTKEDVDYIKANYATLGSEAIAFDLNKTPMQVRTKASSLGLHLTKEATRRIVHARASEHMKAFNPSKTPEDRARISRQNLTPEGKERTKKFMECKAKILKTKPSGLEIKLHSILDSLSVSYETSYMIKRSFFVDVKIGKLIIQADGDYWHGHPRFEPLTERQIKQQKRDAAQDKYLKARGFSVVRIWECEMSPQIVMDTLSDHGIRFNKSQKQLSLYS
jgi:G:T-mismatch repair DNA endonuclease (very short patch repair protein)